MSVIFKQDWVTIDTENPDFWTNQSETFRKELITSVSLVKALPNTRVDNGLNIHLCSKNAMNCQVWIRYKDFDKAEADYRTLIREL